MPGTWKSPEARERSIAALRKHQYRDGGEFWRGKIVIPKHGHKLTCQLFELMNKDMTTIHEVSRRAGIARTTLYKWRERPREPDLGLLEACLNVLGYELKIVPSDTARPKKYRPKAAAHAE